MVSRILVSWFPETQGWLPGAPAAFPVAHETCLTGAGSDGISQGDCICSCSRTTSPCCATLMGCGYLGGTSQPTQLLSRQCRECHCLWRQGACGALEEAHRCGHSGEGVAGRQGEKERQEFLAGTVLPIFSGIWYFHCGSCAFLEVSMLVVQWLL